MKTIFTRIAVSFIFLAAAAICTAEQISDKKKGRHSLWFDLRSSDGKSVISDEKALSSIYLYESEKHEALGGIQFATEKITLAGEYRYNFCTGTYGTVAVEGISSIEKYSDISIRTNNFLGVVCQFDFHRNFFVGCELLGGIKSVYYIDLDIPVKWKVDPLMAFNFGYRNSLGTKIQFSLSSRDTFNIPNFGYIYFNLGLRQDFSTGVSLKVDFSVRTIDLMTISSNIDGWSCSYGFGFRL